MNAPILIVDDSLTVRADLEEIFAEAGLACLACATLAQARAALRGAIGLVVLDLALPDGDGVELLREIRARPGGAALPVLMLSSEAQVGERIRGLAMGSNDYVGKPYDRGYVLARAAALLRKDGAAAGPPGAPRILAVDDSPSYLHAQAEVLLAEGYEVILARSGEEALRMMGARAVDCILLDRIMPGLGGTETCRRLKADPATRDIPLIMLTALEDRGAMIEGLGTGADDYVLKSSEFDVLKARVRAQLRRKQFEDEGRRMRAELAARELEAADARAARALAESRAELLAILEQKNRDLELAVRALQERQDEIAAKNRQLEEASRLKSEFLSNMSHELRTPLNAIIGFSELLRGGVVGPLSAKQHACVGHVVGSGKHLLELINDILDLSKVEAGKMTLELEPVAPDALLQGCLSIVQEGAAQRNIALEFQPCGADGPAMFDLRKLKQMAYNLLSNAVKFSVDGGRVTLAARRLARARIGQDTPAGMTARVLPLPPGDCEQWLEISVRDAGIGIEAGELAHLFQSFRQLDSSMARHHEGSGLGLALVSRMAALHGGTVGVASGAGLGSLFSIWLPWRAPAAEGVAEGAGAPPRRVLVIEDDAGAAELLRLHFESLGFSVAIAADAGAALALAGEGAPDLITLDLILPGASGWEVLERLQAMPRLAGTPVLIVSLVAAELKACALGAAQLLQKPVRHRDLMAAVYALGLGSDSAAAPCVLLVDADAAAAALVAAQLDGLNYRVLCAPDGRGAIEMARARRPDLIIVDLLLPDGSGFELIEELRQWPETARVPLLVLTTATVGLAERERLNGHVLRIMEKGSFNRPQLLREINRALQGQLAEPP